MSEINLKKSDEGLDIIDTPSGKRVDIETIEEWSYYINYYNCELFRFIEEIDQQNNIVYYRDINRMAWKCSKEQFVEDYGFEATDAEVDFLTETWE